MDYGLFKEFCCQNNIEFTENEPMCSHTTFKIGGPVDIFVMPKNEAELSLIIKKIKDDNLPYFVLGKGSNLLVSDDGIEGIVISLSSLNSVVVEGNCITAQAGAKLSSVCAAALENGLGGLEFAFGIPGSVGGAMFMNAGAYGGEMSQIVKSAQYIDENGKIKSIDVKDMCLGYRKSIFTLGGKVIIGVTFELNRCEASEIKAKMDDYINRRRSKQPLEYPSAGSTFKRPEGNFAGALIEKNNLKGLSIGGASVSKKHAGFIINKNNASCKDVRCLISEVKRIVLEKDGVNLEPEVIYVGRGE